MKRIVAIAIGGQCYTGKSSIGRALAKTFDWNYVNIGSYFRSLTQQHNGLLDELGKFDEEFLRSID